VSDFGQVLSVTHGSAKMTVVAMGSAPRRGFVTVTKDGTWRIVRNTSVIYHASKESVITNLGNVNVTQDTSLMTAAKRSAPVKVSLAILSPASVVKRALHSPRATTTKESANARRASRLLSISSHHIVQNESVQVRVMRKLRNVIALAMEHVTTPQENALVRLDSREIIVPSKLLSWIVLISAWLDSKQNICMQRQHSRLPVL